MSISIEYAYDKNGNLIRDDNKGMTFTYDLLGHPLAIAGSDNQTDYVYSADGRKFRATHTQCTFKNGALDVCHYFIQDYQGNNRILIGSNGQRDQYSHYYPYGGLIGDISTNDPHSYKYGGKELDRDFGIDLFDFEARQYDAKVPGFTSIDPLAEKYYGISPYAYCAGDPVNCVDPTGMDTVRYTYSNGAWSYSDPIISEGDDVFILDINGESTSYIFTAGEYGKRVCQLYLDFDYNPTVTAKGSVSLMAYHVSGAETGGTGFMATPSGDASLKYGSHKRMPDGNYVSFPE